MKVLVLIRVTINFSFGVRFGVEFETRVTVRFRFTVAVIIRVKAGIHLAQVSTQSIQGGTFSFRPPALKCSHHPKVVGIRLRQDLTHGLNTIHQTLTGQTNEKFVRLRLE